MTSEANSVKESGQKYAVFIDRSKLENAPIRIVLYCKKAGDLPADFCDSLSVVRYNRLEDAVKSANDILISNHGQGFGVERVGVIPIDTGEYLYKMADGELKVGLPVYSARSMTTVVESSFNPDEWKYALNKRFSEEYILLESFKEEIR